MFLFKSFTDKIRKNVASSFVINNKVYNFVINNKRKRIKMCRSNEIIRLCRKTYENIPLKYSDGCTFDGGKISSHVLASPFYRQSTWQSVFRFDTCLYAGASMVMYCWLWSLWTLLCWRCHSVFLWHLINNKNRIMLSVRKRTMRTTCMYSWNDPTNALIKVLVLHFEI